MIQQDSATVLATDLLTTGYGQKAVSTGLTLQLLPGQVTCLIGSNGVGKSTLLRTLSGAQKPLAGNVMVMGRSMTRYTERELSRLIGLVLTQPVRSFAMTVRDVLAQGRAPYTGYFGTLSSQDKDIIQQSALMTGCQHLVDREISSLSDGEAQKVMIAKALAQQTPVILLDEPSAFLDFPSKVELMLMLQRLARESNKSILLSTHDISLALKTADILWLMHDGTVTVGTPQTLQDSGQIQQFLGESSRYL